MPIFSRALTFAIDSSVIPAEYFSELNRLTDVIGDFLEKREIPSIRIDGYTDNTGTPEHNIILSQARAMSIMMFILDKYKDRGLSGEYFTARGLGASNFIGDNSTEQGRSSNRRIELLITGKNEEKKVILAEAQKNDAPGFDYWKSTGIALLDIGLSGFTAYMLYDQRKAADDYERQFPALDNPFGTNYDRLISMKKSVDDKQAVVMAGACLAGAAIAYTIADYIWFKNIFPSDVKFGLNTSGSTLIFCAGGSFK